MNREEEIKQEKLELRKQLESKDCDLDAIKAKLDALEKEEAELRKKQEIVDKLNGGEPIGKPIEKRKEENTMDNDEKFGTIEYRKAFARYATMGTPIPVEYRDETGTMKRTDAGAVLPTTIQNRIVEKMENAGVLYNLVSKSAYPSGLSIPTSTALPAAEWVAEGGTTASKKKTYGSITFAGNKIRVAVSCSLELSIAALSAFEANLADNIAKAMVKAFDTAIISGSGSGCPKGILTETAADTVVLDKLNYAKLNEMEAAIPSAYDVNAKYFMSKKTLFALKSLKDASGVVAVETVDGKPAYSLLGREVVIVDALPDLSKATSGQVVAFAIDPSEYLFNFNYAVTVSRRENWDNEDQEMKAVAVADGKLVDANGLVFFTAPASA